MALYGYCRVSTVEQEDNHSLPAQKARISRTMHGEPDQIFIDVASGGTELFKRPSGADLKQLLKKGDKVIVSKLDRGFRNAGDFLSVINYCDKLGVELILLDLGEERGVNHPDNATGKLMASMFAIFAEFERNRIRERTREGLATAKSKGVKLGSSNPVIRAKHRKKSIKAKLFALEVLDRIDDILQYVGISMPMSGVANLLTKMSVKTYQNKDVWSSRQVINVFNKLEEINAIEPLEDGGFEAVSPDERRQIKEQLQKGEL